MLKIHILNVGHGDCIIIEFPSDRLTMIDINNGTEMDDDSINEVLKEVSTTSTLSELLLYLKYKAGNISYKSFRESVGYSVELENPINYLEKNFKDKKIFRFISTHPHMDHLTGLSLIKDKIVNAWISPNNQTQDDSKLSEVQVEDWKLYKKLRDHKERKVEDIIVISPKAGSTDNFYTDDGIFVISPSEDLLALGNNPNNYNKLSTVIVVKYGGHKIVFAGDSEKETWDYILENHKELITDVTILKAAHHGRDSGYHSESLKVMKPKYTIVSVGKKPEQDASNKYRNYSDNVWSTRWKGNIVFTIYEDGTGSYETQFDR